MLLGLTGRTTSYSFQGFAKRLYHHEFEAFSCGLRRSDKYVYPWRTPDYNICGVKKDDFKEDNTFNAASGTARITDKFDKLSTSAFHRLPMYLPIPAQSTHFHLISAHSSRAQAQFFLCGSLKNGECKWTTDHKRRIEKCQGSKTKDSFLNTNLQDTPCNNLNLDISIHGNAVRTNFSW